MANGNEALTPDDILALWEKNHQKLPARQKKHFLQRPEVSQLTNFPETIVETATKTSPRLTKILRKAQELLAETTRGKKPAKGILPLPGDPGATKRLGKTRERYRTGPEAEIRHIARQYKWWE